MKLTDTLLVLLFAGLAIGLGAFVYMNKTDEFAAIEDDKLANAGPVIAVDREVIEEHAFVPPEPESIADSTIADAKGMYIKLVTVDGKINKHENPIINHYCEFGVIYAKDKDAISLDLLEKRKAKVVQYYLDGNQKSEEKNVDIPYRMKRSYKAMPDGAYEVTFRILDAANQLYEVKKTIYVRSAPPRNTE